MGWPGESTLAPPEALSNAAGRIQPTRHGVTSSPLSGRAPGSVRKLAGDRYDDVLAE